MGIHANTRQTRIHVELRDNLDAIVESYNAGEISKELAIELLEAKMLPDDVYSRIVERLGV